MKQPKWKMLENPTPAGPHSITSTWVVESIQIEKKTPRQRKPPLSLWRSKWLEGLIPPLPQPAVQVSYFGELMLEDRDRLSNWPWLIQS